MKKLYSIILTSILFSIYTLSEGQNISSKEHFNSYEERADSLKKNQQFDLARKERLEICRIDSSYTSNLYELAALYSLSQKNDSAFLYLTQATAFDSTIDLLVNPDYFFIYKDDRWIDIQNSQIAKFEDINGKFKNLPLAKMLWEMKMKDQSYYVFMDYTKQEQVKKYWQIKDSINKYNLFVLDSIIRESGWPKISEVGKDGSSAAFLIIQHAELATQKKYFRYLKKAVKQHEAYPRQLALLNDRIRDYDNKKQIYGSQISWDPVTQKNYFNYDKLKRPSKVNNEGKV